MKKKTVALMLAAAMAASLTACGGSGETAETKAEETTKTESAAKEDAAKEEEVKETEAATEKPDGSGYKIGLVTDVGGVNDASFNQSSWEGLQRAAEEFGVEVNYLESSTDSDYVPNIETFVDEDYDLIISVGYMLADATRQAAEEYPDNKFAIIDDASIDLPNVTCLMFRQEQASYLVGYVAGLMTKTEI